MNKSSSNSARTLAASFVVTASMLVGCGGSNAEPKHSNPPGQSPHADNPPAPEPEGPIATNPPGPNGNGDGSGAGPIPETDAPEDGDAPE